MGSWHTQLEKDLIESFGGEWEQSFGVDGEIDGDPVEVRVAKNDDRFRLGKDVHRELVRNDGAYILDDVSDNKPPKKVPAVEVSDMIGGGPWFEDRDYPHKFLDVDDIF